MFPAPGQALYSIFTMSWEYPVFQPVPNLREIEAALCFQSTILVCCSFLIIIIPKALCNFWLSEQHHGGQ